MSDQGKWFKLWCSALSDPSLSNLPNEDWARWAKLGAYIKLHGNDGKLIIQAPALALQTLFQVSSFEAVMCAIKRFPNCKYGERKSGVSGETNSNVSLDVEYLNWHKYQDDLSSTRVRNFRARKRLHETIQEEKRSRREEKRTEENTKPPNPLPGGTKVLEWFEKTWKHYPAERRHGKKAAFRSYQRTVKTLEEAKACARALENYLASETVKKGFVQKGSTFFNNWEDHRVPRDMPGFSSEEIDRRPTKAPPDSGGFVTAGAVLERVTNSSPPSDR